MFRRIKTISQYLSLSLLILFASIESVIAQSSSWEKPYAGNDSTLLYYPDQNAVYFRYGWENTKENGLLIKGKLPQARYFSFNLYDDYSKTSLFALADYEILPDKDDPLSYTIHIVPEGQSSRYSNQIVLPDSIRFTSVFLRYYLPSINIYANVELPSIYFIKNNEQKPVLPSLGIPAMTKEATEDLKKVIKKSPFLISSKERKILASSTAFVSDKEPIICKVLVMPIFNHYKDPSKISAYNFNSGGTYPNRDNNYITMPLERKRKDDVLIVRFKAPTHAQLLGDTTKQVRYYSLSQGNEYTNNAMTMYDNQLNVSKDGYTYIALANDTKEARAKASELGINFMPFRYEKKIVLLLRHMLSSANFKNSTREVPIFIKGKPASEQGAENTIGDYALIGKFIKSANWNSFKQTSQFGF